jgi:hypothetical protein
MERLPALVKSFSDSLVRIWPPDSRILIATDEVGNCQVVQLEYPNTGSPPWWPGGNHQLTNFLGVETALVVR